MPEPLANPSAASEPQPADLEHFAIRAAVAGADTVREGWDDLGDVTQKSGPTDPVTSLDRRTEEVIRASIVADTPGASFIGEELGRATGQTRIGWIVDPIDGTVNLTYGLQVVGVSVAATIDGQVVAGAVVDVTARETFSGTFRGGARLNGERIAPPYARSLDQALIGTGFAYDAKTRGRETEQLSRLLPAARDIRCIGSSALNLCWVASGRLDGFYQRHMHRWDYAAGALIASEAGAVIRRASDAEDDLLVAAGPGVLAELMQLVS